MMFRDGYTHLHFVYLKPFEVARRDLLSDDDLREIENVLLENPRTGVVVPGTGGIRKLRVGLEGRGKRGGGRLLYLYVEVFGRIYFILVYSKNVRESLSETQKKQLRTLVKALEQEIL